MSRADLERALWAILDTLREYLDDLILIGGWVPYLHFRYGRVANPEAGVSLTAEADLVIPPHLPGQGRRTIAGILEDAAFNPIDENRVVWGRDVEGGERIEFLLSNEGPALHAARPVPISGQPGIRGLALNLLWPLPERVRDLVRRAEYHLRNLAERYYPHAVELLTERDGMPPAAAQADLEGHLADLAALLQAASQG